MILKFVGAAVLAILVGIGGWKSYDSNQQHNALADIGRLVRGKDATVRAGPSSPKRIGPWGCFICPPANAIPRPRP